MRTFLLVLLILILVSCSFNSKTPDSEAIKGNWVVGAALRDGEAIESAIGMQFNLKKDNIFQTNSSNLPNNVPYSLSDGRMNLEGDTSKFRWLNVTDTSADLHVYLRESFFEFQMKRKKK